MCEFALKVWLEDGSSFAAREAICV